MSAEACTEFRRSYLVYRGALNWLANENLKKRKCRFHLRPKVHQLSHICWDFLPLNPRRYSNYLDEDFIFKTKKGGRTCAPPAFANACLYAIQHSGMFAMVRWSSVKMVWKRRGVKKTGKTKWTCKIFTVIPTNMFSKCTVCSCFPGLRRKLYLYTFWFENIYHLERCGLLDLLVFQSV